MEKYNKYRIEDFVWDDYFRQWVLAPNRENHQDWSYWLLENPEFESVIESAKEIVLSLSIQEPDLSDNQITTSIRTIIESIENHERSKIKRAKFFHNKLWVGAAAAVVVLIGVVLYFNSVNTKEKNILGKSYVFDNDPSLVISMIVKQNVSDSTETILLVDGSIIFLKPQGSIRYSSEFDLAKREVYLSGKAFFEVAKNPDKPFFVFTKDIVTKVLGTSFMVDAFDDSGEITVSVKTGRVSVFAQNDPNFNKIASNRELEGVILNPNQKITYNKKDISMVKSIVAEPTLVLPPSEQIAFDFEETPANIVFDKIAKAYGIEIIYDEELLKGCPLTAYLQSQNLYEKLTIVCKAVEADYEILNGQIFIHSKGCQNF